MDKDIEAIYRALDLDPNEYGSNEQEVAEPASTDDSEGSKDQDFADLGDDDTSKDDNEAYEEPSDNSSDEEYASEESEEEHDNDNNNDEPAKPKQTSEENRKYQAMRHKKQAQLEAEKRYQESLEAEKQRYEAELRAKEEEKSAALAEVDKFIAAQGLVNPYKDDAPITNKAEYDEYMYQDAAEKASQGDTSPEVIRRLVQAEINKTEPQAQTKTTDIEKIRQEEREKARLEFEARRLFEKDLQEVMRLDPEVKRFEDIANRPYGQTVLDNLKNKMTLINAFNIGARDFLIEREKERAVTSARTKEAGKSHLKTPNGRGSGKDITVPTATLRYYKNLIPGIKDSEIKKLYQADQERLRKK